LISPESVVWSQKLTALNLLGLGSVFCFAVNGENIFYCIGTALERAKDMPVYMITHVASSWATDNIAKSLQEFLS
jgi:hypothetical protein